MITEQTINDVLEMFYNETDDLDEIADRLDMSILDIAMIIHTEG
jgi:hypothetical protein